MEKYSFEDICKLFSWGINYVPLAIGGYKYDERTKTLPVLLITILMKIHLTVIIRMDFYRIMVLLRCRSQEEI